MAESAGLLRSFAPLYGGLGLCDDASSGASGGLAALRLPRRL